MPSPRLHLLAALLATSAAALCLAQPPATPATPPTKPTDDDAMRGPSVKETVKPATLVQRDMSGNFIRLDTRPEGAALDLIKLTAEQRKPADEVLAKRAVAVTKFLQERYDTFIKIQIARQGGAKAEELRPMMREFRPFAEPLLSPTLSSQVAAVLPEEKRAEYLKLIDDYKRAMLADEPGGSGAGAGTGGGGGAGRGRRAPEGAEKPDGAGDPKAEPKKMDDSGPIPPRVEMNLLIREMARTLKGIADERKEHMDAFLKAIEATPEQDAKIRAITREAAEATRGKGKDGSNGANKGLSEPSQEEKIATWKKILDVLTPEQRKKAMEARRAGT